MAPNATQSEHRDPDVRVAEVRPKQGGHDDRDHDEEAAHRGRAGLAEVRFRAFFPDVLPDGQITQLPNEHRTEHNGQKQSRQSRERGAKRIVLENAERRELPEQLFEK